MKTLAFGLAILLCLTLSASAAPVLTEIRLVNSSRNPQSSFEQTMVFRADGKFFWREGTQEKSLRRVFVFEREEFARLARAFEASDFAEFEAPKPNPNIPFCPPAEGKGWFLQTKTRGQTKIQSSEKYRDLARMVRGFAAEFVGLSHMPRAAFRPAPTPTPTPIPIFRGTNAGQ